MVRLAALLAPAFTIFYSRIYEYPDVNERKILHHCLFFGFVNYIIIAAMCYYLI